MANQSPFTGASDAAGGILLLPEQGGVLTEGLLQRAGALSLAGDARATSSRKTQFQVWKGKPTAEFVDEAGTKPVTGAEFGAGTLNIKKVASIVVFTDEMIEDLQAGDLNVLVDGGIRDAIAQKLDAHAIGLEAGSPISTQFDDALTETTQRVNLSSTAQDAFALAVSAAMGSLEANGYTDFAALVPTDFARHLRDARTQGVSGGGTASPTLTNLPQGLYQQINDPLYGIPRAASSNLATLASGGTVGVVWARQNQHVRVRRDVYVSKSNEATVGGTSLWQTDMQAARYVTRQGQFIHDLNRAVVKIVK